MIISSSSFASATHMTDVASFDALHAAGAERRALLLEEMAVEILALGDHLSETATSSRPTARRTGSEWRSRTSAAIT